MISVVICSINSTYADQVRKNISETIGVEHEIILMDNTRIKKSISAVYNMGAASSKFGIVCFVHEDVLFETNGWGSHLVSLFDNDQQLGVIGLAGSKYKSRTISGWSSALNSLDCSNVHHIDKYNRHKHIYFNPQKSKRLQEVVSLDGVFICSRKSVWEEIKFNEELLDGFHCYDIDYSVRASWSWKVAVTYDIKMVHLTKGGDFGDKWIHYTMLWHDKYQDQLPCVAEDLHPEPARYEKLIKRYWLDRLKSEKISVDNRLRWLLATGAIAQPAMWPSILMFFMFRPYRKFLTIFTGPKNTQH